MLPGMQTTQSWRLSLNKQCWTAFRSARSHHVRRSLSVQAGIASGIGCSPVACHACRRFHVCAESPHNKRSRSLGCAACRTRELPARSGSWQPGAEPGAADAGAAGAGPDCCVARGARAAAPPRHSPGKGPGTSSPDSQRRAARLRGVHLPAAVFGRQQRRGWRPADCTDVIRGAGSCAAGAQSRRVPS
jgi:hypothetical protein